MPVSRPETIVTNLPMTVDAIPADFMADMNAFTMEDAANRKITDRLAVRLNVLDCSQRSYIDLGESNLRAMRGAMTLKLTPTTTVRLEGDDRAI